MCNINTAEIAYRRKAMWFGVVLTLLLFVVMVALGLPVLLRLVLFVPIFIAVIGYLQSKNRFCVSYAASGKQNAAEGSKSATAVDAAAHAADTRKARIMNTQAALVSLAFTLIFVLL